MAMIVIWTGGMASVGVIIAILFLLFGAIPRWRADAAGKTGDAADWGLLLFAVGPIGVVLGGIIGALAGALIGTVITLFRLKS